MAAASARGACGQSKACSNMPILCLDWHSQSSPATVHYFLNDTGLLAVFIGCQVLPQQLCKEQTELRSSLMELWNIAPGWGTLRRSLTCTKSP